jgi:hypothetical protein
VRTACVSGTACASPLEVLEAIHEGYAVGLFAQIQADEVLGVTVFSKCINSMNMVINVCMSTKCGVYYIYCNPAGET